MLCCGQCRRVSLKQMSLAPHTKHLSVQLIIQGCPVLFLKKPDCVREHPLQKPGSQKHASAESPPAALVALAGHGITCSPPGQKFPGGHLLQLDVVLRE